MLAILSTHPIQYQVPLWQALARDGRVPFEVWYVSDHGTRVSHDREFGQAFSWDLPTLSGYPSRFLESVAGDKPVTFRGWRLKQSLRPLLEASGARALWIQGWHVGAYWQAVVGARGARVPVWMRGESNDLRPSPPMKKVVKTIVLGWLFSRVDQFLYIGQANRRLYKNYGVPDSKLHFAPYAIDNERFARQAAELQPERLAIRESWGIPQNAFCVLYCGKLIPKKHPASIVEAARLLRQSGRIAQVHPLFVGSGELEGELREACSVAQTPATFAGFLNQREISKAYVAADCLALPSDTGETWGLVVNEALASGLPCVSSRQAGCTEDLVARHWPGRTFDYWDVAGLASAIYDAWKTGRDTKERMAVADYSYEATCNEVVRLYGELTREQK